MVRIARVGDLGHLDAMLDPVLTEQLKATLAAMARATRAPGDPRSHAERCADALEQVLRTGMDGTDLPTRARRRPHAILHAQLETLLGLPGHAQPLLERFGLIGAPTAQRLTCDAILTLVLKHGDTVLNVGRTHRVVTHRQHTALAATYRGCVVPGCAVKFSDCDIHHLWWWSLGGPTDLDLQLPLCQSHHRWLHEGGYTIARDHGELVFRSPRGRTIANLDHLLQQQLDLLQQRPPPADPATDTLVDDAIDKATANGEWPDTPYQHGTWGRSGQHPGSPPGHAPPEAS